MSRSTCYYIVELTKGVFAKRYGTTPDYSDTLFPSDATHYSLSEARCVCKWERESERDIEPRRKSLARS